MVVGVPGADTREEYENFVKNHGLEAVPQVPDYNGDLWRGLGNSSQPRWMLVRADGTTERGFGAPPPEIVDDALTPA